MLLVVVLYHGATMITLGMEVHVTGLHLILIMYWNRLLLAHNSLYEPGANECVAKNVELSKLTDVCICVTLAMLLIFTPFPVNETCKSCKVNKTFRLQLENSKATKLELVSELVGNRDKPAYRSSAANSTEASNGFGIKENDSLSEAVDEKVENDSCY